MGKKVLLTAGGDKRMKYAGEYLSDIYNVYEADGYDGKADAVLLPAVGSDKIGEPWLTALLEKLNPGGAVFCGVEKGFVRKQCASGDIRYANYMELPELALANAVLTAEAAIKLAIEETEAAVWRSRVFVAGFGRIGEALTHRLLGLGARVTAGARKEYDRMRIKAAGAEPSELPASAELLSQTDIIFNTVPAEIFGREQLSSLSRQCVYIELASAPGGVCKEAIGTSGCRIVSAPGLPAGDMR